MCDIGKEDEAYSRLEAVRGAGMSQRTRRPYLQYSYQFQFDTAKGDGRIRLQHSFTVAARRRNLPLKLVSEIASTRAMAEACYVESGTRARHGSRVRRGNRERGIMRVGQVTETEVLEEINLCGDDLPQT
jgi:hypothetical protein